MKESKKIYIVSVSLILLFELVFLYYIKYSNQDLTLSDFSLINVGNIFNLAVILIMILGIIIYLRRRQSKTNLITTMVLISLAALFFAFFSTITKFPTGGLYILGAEGDKLFDAIVLTGYHFILFTFLSVIWLKVFRSERKILIRSLINSAIIIFVFLGSTYIFILEKEYSTVDWKLEKNQKNIAVVLGAAVWSDNQPSPSLSRRIERAVELYKKGFVGKILLTGGKAPGEMTEAEVAYEYARRKGMEMSKVKFENLTTSTTEQIKYIKNKLVGDPGIEDIIVISDAYHLVRVLEISKFYNADIKVAASRLKSSSEENKFYRLIRECIALTVFWSFAL